MITTLMVLSLLSQMRSAEGVVSVPASPPAVIPAAVPTAPGARSPLAAGASVEVLLDALHKRGLDLVDFDADVKLLDIDPALGTSTDRMGRILYHTGGAATDGLAKLRVTFTTRDDGTGPRPDRLEYLLDGRVLTDRNYRKRIEVRRRVLREGEKMNLLRLGEGPFPLPIGQEPAEVRRQFTVTLLEPEGSTPRLRLAPREGTRLATKFSQIDVWVDPETHFPVKISTLDGNRVAERGTELTNLRVNPAGGLKDADFVLPAVGGDWQTTDEAYRD
jgi:hypothetical protein